MNNDIKAFYDATAETTANEWYPNELLKSTILDFVSLLPKEPTILDLGCGPGHESKRLAQTGAIVTGIDFSEECIAIAKERCPECKFEVRDFKDLKNEIGVFDGIFACASLIHIAPSELPLVFSNIIKILKINGFLNLLILDGEGISDEFSNLMINEINYNRTVYLYNQKTIMKEVKQFGLEFIREGFLNEELKEYGWRNYIFRLSTK
jgi:SAM-dependent methyltransferase